ncbi:unnamed protein product [Cylindrotheca closterium]|uniref:Uncharacterized protein n=1 Tax=Cylindrotheca closterium TaxID=2856 RepID=A0AAD2CED0_9STRA|nr:unnamed protein product [Cylindrotheca closterium]
MTESLFPWKVAKNRVKVDGFLTGLTNVKGFDAKSIAEKKANSFQTVHQAGHHDDNENDDEEEEDPNCLMNHLMMIHLASSIGMGSEEMYEEAKSIMEKMMAMKPPEKVIHYEVFIRITQVSTGQVISQGFCNNVQRRLWRRGLKEKEEHFPFLLKQGLEITFDFDSLAETEEMKEFLQRYTENVLGPCTCFCEEFRDFKIPFCFTAIVIDKRDQGTQCLFQQDKSRELRLRRVCQTPGSEEGRFKHEFVVYSTWGGDTVQLGPSSCTDRYRLSYSLSLHASSPAFGINVIPVFDINVELDDRMNRPCTNEKMNE